MLENENCPVDLGKHDFLTELLGTERKWNTLSFYSKTTQRKAFLKFQEHLMLCFKDLQKHFEEGLEKFSVHKI